LLLLSRSQWSKTFAPNSIFKFRRKKSSHRQITPLLGRLGLPRSHQCPLRSKFQMMIRSLRRNSWLLMKLSNYKLHSAVLLVVLWGLWLPVRFHYLLDFPFAMDCNNLELSVLKLLWSYCSGFWMIWLQFTTVLFVRFSLCSHG
jgi:hypothetical protein